MSDKSTEIDGLKELEKNFTKLLEQSSKANGKAMTDIALDLLGKAINLAPVDLGDLRGSGTAKVGRRIVAKGTTDGNVQVIGTGEEQENVSVAYIGFEEPYAIRQHEHTEYKHPKGGEAKYLEKPFRQNISKYIKHIADANKKALK